MNKLELEAEMGRLFLRVEQLKAEQGQIAQRLNQILQELMKLEEANATPPPA
jgi:uncharacterized protein YfdQ (DUF2303 family)